MSRARQAIGVVVVGVALAACTASSDDSTSSSAPATSDSVSVSTSSQPNGSTPSTTAPPDPSHKMFVADVLLAGSEFDVMFSGSLGTSRGGYLWLQEVDGTRVALLRGDGNSEIPMSYDLDVTNATMLDDGLSGDVSTFVLPPQIDPGRYRLCTANSLGDDCIEVEVAAA